MSCPLVSFPIARQGVSLVSALAPIAAFAPMRCPWGQKAFTHYLGPHKGDWYDYDASELVLKRR